MSSLPCSQPSDAAVDKRFRHLHLPPLAVSPGNCTDAPVAYTQSVSVKLRLAEFFVCFVLARSLEFGVYV